MDKKKIIGIVVFIILGLVIFTFANPAPSTLDPVDEPGQEDKQPDKDEQQEEESEQDEEESETVGNIQDEEQEESVVDYYQLALEAIIKAEGSLVQDDIDAAKDLIDNVNEDLKEDLVNRIENVQNVVDYNKLLTELENKVNSSTNKDELNSARDYNTTNDLANKLASLNDDVNKTNLLNRYNVLLPKLNDTTAPMVSGVLNDSYVNSLVSLTISDDASFIATLNGENYITGTEINEDGTYTLVVVDSSFNDTVVTFTIDTTAPVFTGIQNGHQYPEVTLGLTEENIDEVIIYNRDLDKYYDFSEGMVLTDEGTYTAYAKDKAGNLSGAREDGIIYFAIDNTNPEVIDITQVYEEKEVGRIKVTIKTSEEIFGDLLGSYKWRKVEGKNEYFNYYYSTKEVTINFFDKAGNEGTYTFTVDKTAPTASITMSNNNGLTSTNKDVTVTLVASEDILDIEGWTKVDSKTFTKVYSENGKYSVEITDLVGNKSTIKFEVKRIDKVAPVITVVEPNRYNIEVNTPYVDKGYSAYDVVDKDLTNRVTMTYQFLPLGSGNWEGVDSVDTSKLGTYKITYHVLDKAGNEGTATRSFEIVDSSLPVITVKEESIGTISENIFSNVSFKLYDKHLVTKVYINDLEKILSPNSWSDLNNVAVGKNGGVYGKNTITLVDAYGNEKKYEFILDNKVPQLAPESWTVTLEADRNANFVCPDMTQYGTDEYGIAKVELDQYFNDNLTNVDVTKPGKFICRYITTDKAGNKASNDIFYNVVDTTAPKTKAANILVNGDVNEQKVFYATYGDKIYAYVRFDEELKNVPTFTIINNGNEYVVDTKDVTIRSFDDGQYQYSIYYEITSDTTMTDGEITMRVSNIEDLYGNKANDIIKPTNGHVVYLDTTPAGRVYSTLDFDGTGIVPEIEGTRKTYYVKDGSSFVFRMQFTEQLLENPILNVDNKQVELELVDKYVTEEGKYIYQGTVEINAEDNFKDGILILILSNVKDLAGNETTSIEILDQTVTSNDRTAVIDNTKANAKPLYILARDDANYRLSISDGEYLRVEANFDEELKELPILKIGSQTMEFNRCNFNSTNTLYVCVADMKIDNEIAKLQEGEIIPFEVINVVDLAGNETSFDNTYVTKYYQNGKLIYDQVTYENPFVSMTFHNSTNYKLNIENGNDDLSLTEAKIGDTVRVFVRFNQDLDVNNFKPLIVIGGVSKELKLSNIYSDGTKDYGADITITNEMDLTSNKEISFVIKNIVLENGNSLPNLTQKDITSNTLSGVIYVED